MGNTNYVGMNVHTEAITIAARNPAGKLFVRRDKPA
jgi:hypothetical protein